MFLPFKIKAEEINKLQKDKESIPFDDYDDSVKTSLNILKNKIVGNNGVIDGSSLQDAFFPAGTQKYDIFISHSHNDLEIAKFLAAWIKNEHGLVCFLDTFVWSSADKLLRDIDNEYCKSERDDKLFDYKKRNFSTSHVHAMLSMAILEIINITECPIFIESGESINLKEGIGNKTLSPWLYEEISFMKHLKCIIPKRYFAKYNNINFDFQKNGLYRILAESKNKKNLKIDYEIDTDDIAELLSEDLNRSVKDKASHDDGLNWLDDLYQDKYSYEEYTIKKFMI
jgi:hypothetical protein